MQFEIYQWLVPIIGIFFIIRTLRAYFKGRRSTGSIILWLIFWITIVILAVIPNELSYKLASMLGFKSNVNAVIFIALGILFAFVFYLSSTIERLEEQITQLTRKIAIERQDLIEHNPEFKLNGHHHQEKEDELIQNKAASNKIKSSEK